MFTEIDTPAVLVDLEIAEANIFRYQAYCDRHGIQLRPHIKTHKLPFLGRAQITAGATGITCQKISEAEVIASEGGIEDILLTYNILGAAKLARLRALAQLVKLAVVADSLAVVDGLSKEFRAHSSPLEVLVECDTGAGRCGVQTPEAARDLALEIDAAPGLSFGGLLTYPPPERLADVHDWLRRARRICQDAGLRVRRVSSGGSPDMWRAHDMPVVTEYRVGNYVYNDRSVVERGACGWEDCALSVLSTVVSTPNENRAVIDAGSKVLTADLVGLEGHGYVVGRPEIVIDLLNEEHGRMVSASATGLTVGEKVRIIPNHACVVANMLDRVALVRGSKQVGIADVPARGKVC